jgi:hypothetical protein
MLHVYNIACFSFSNVLEEDYAFLDVEVTVFGLNATLSMFVLLLVP